MWKRGEGEERGQEEEEREEEEGDEGVRGVESRGKRGKSEGWMTGKYERLRKRLE